MGNLAMQPGKATLYGSSRRPQWTRSLLQDCDHSHSWTGIHVHRIQPTHGLIHLHTSCLNKSPAALFNVFYLPVTGSREASMKRTRSEAVYCLVSRICPSDAL